MIDDSIKMSFQNNNIFIVKYYVFFLKEIIRIKHSDINQTTVREY